MVKPGGTVVALGGWLTVPVHLPTIVSQEIKIRGSINFSMPESLQALTWLDQNRFDPTLLVADIFPLSEGAAVFAKLTARRPNEIKVVLTHSVNGL